MNKKKITCTMIASLIIIVSIVAYLLLKSSNQGTAIAIITDYKGYKAVYAKLDSINDSSNIIIYSTIFKVGDKIKVEYHKNDGNYQIDKLEFNINTDEQKKQMVQNLNDDRKLGEYKGINVCKFYRGEETLDCSNLGIIPTKISGQVYSKIITPEDYFKVLKNPVLNTFKDEKIILTLTNNFKVLKFENINDGTAKKISYELNDKSITLKSLGYGIYVVQIEFENGDIINFLFI